MSSATGKAQPETIAAIATATGSAGVGIVRVSGANLLDFAEALGGKRPEPRRATLSDFRAADGSVVDCGLLIHFPAPHSFTGEDVLEIHGHGGRVVMQMLLARCLELGARLAEPGEFTRRAFLNGKLDLAQAEAVIDLIEAATSAAARSAVRSLQGEFSREVQALLGELVELRALVEATLDFPDEEIDFLEAADAFARLDRLADRLGRVFDRAEQGRLLRTGLHVVLAGQPNVGKSSLLNRLAGDDLAIVTPLPGTTRDVVRGTLQIEGIPLHIIDTAGLRETDDLIEKMGIERSWREIERADVVVLLVDARVGSGESEEAILRQLPDDLVRITVYNKIDLAGRPAERHGDGRGVALSLSAKTGEGIGLLREELLAAVGWHPAEDVFIARERHLRALAETREHIDAARTQLGRLELFAEELRLAQSALNTITGEFSTDDLLGEIFGRFCVGK
ncbi:tRNA uridine-5-carboxymethylaminomethyl(34) synthesis GTPase MnmE [Accumulibacter sp.]|uniref:tRNA uridine-5-carboxymethylaminomethyl(34) synthesis GTPase MnmE n=1 Tax=Accumulibacter sp. TaxID=2053492 RepID=UPI0025EDCCBA|nr:tRNA uridine-5-carboxymethylaminomethyl(34) synthesis GTPase MnmE [Accumulibacter sp.]MCM8594656.1 tRNA uridine-5-carboxymethylaminomethyl(34) synthesis GTPase MnmE [Accumulibacter sp.]MCM8625928.1 tRNA uridine-5-carboxymethylaminomethyl(34) synthesis GTPase MnmE [Accumulibacter sp.]MDS4048802.1 tRNA uridine-5-carboxymethylaminomethyl(34) synthesis GTPase MnmE [Accumulibacter sp.]